MNGVFEREIAVVYNDTQYYVTHVKNNVEDFNYIGGQPFSNWKVQSRCPTKEELFEDATDPTHINTFRNDILLLALKELELVVEW